MNETAGIQRPQNPSFANVYVFPSGLKTHTQIDEGKSSPTCSAEEVPDNLSLPTCLCRAKTYSTLDTVSLAAGAL